MCTICAGRSQVISKEISYQLIGLNSSLNLNYTCGLVTYYFMSNDFSYVEVCISMCLIILPFEEVKSIYQGILTTHSSTFFQFCVCLNVLNDFSFCLKVVKLLSMELLSYLHCPQYFHLKFPPNLKMKTTLFYFLCHVKR